jgi:predicted ATPase/DNA-binding NarL/FixJ family response regulator
MGKTRLALAFAERQLRNFKHGVFFVSLASLDEAEDIVPTVARNLGFSFYEGVDHRQQLIDYLRGKSMLLLLDNLEHLQEGASLVSELVQSAQEVRIIVTSREPLRLLGENLYSVEGFDYQEWATAEAALENDAVQLFLNSARMRRPEFDLGADDLQPMTRICRLVQGMPLGIVLAAGWTKLLSPTEIAEELDQSIDILESDLKDIPERQRSMKAVLDTTWEQLNRREREVLMRLAVFRGGCSQNAIRQVTGATLMELKSLTEKSLINANRVGRHEMHELLRQYAAEMLRSDPEAEFEAHRLHSSYYLKSIAEREDELFGHQVKLVMEDIDSNLVNVRSALHWAATHQQVEYMERAIDPLFQYYFWRDRYHSIIKDAQLIIEGLAQEDSPKARLITAKALARQGWFLLDEEDLELVRKSEAILNRDDLVSLDTRRDRAFVLSRLVELTVGSDPHRGLEMSRECLELYREVGDLRGEAAALSCLAEHASVTGNIEEEKRLRERCTFKYEQLGNPWDLAISLDRLATLAAHLGEVEEAERLATKSYTMLKAVGDPSSIARSSNSLGRTLYRIGRFAEARERLIDAVKRFEDLGHDTMMTYSTMQLAWAYLHLGDYESAHVLAQQCLSYYEPHAIATWARLLLVCLALVRKEPEEVHRQAQIILEIYRARHDWYSEMLCYSLTSMAERLRRNETGYRHYLIEALQITAFRKDFGWVNPTWAAAALFFADRGDVERAVEIYELACQRYYIAVSQWYKDIAGDHIFALAERLPPEVAGAARRRGRERDPVETAKELLAELESAATSKIAPPQSLVESLSERELELLQLVAEGKSNREIAQELILALGTVKSHLHNIFQKLGVRSRTQAVVRANELNLL